MREGSVRTRSGDRYKPSAVRAYERDLRLRIYPELGAMRLGDVRRADLQAFADRLLATGADPSPSRCAFVPLRVIYRRALARDEVAANPTTGLELPAVRGRRDRIASREEATALLGALPADDRGMWGTAFYGGLRRGELRALAWSDVDLAAGGIRVKRSWDQYEGAVEPKSRSGRRSVADPCRAARLLARASQATHAGAEGLVSVVVTSGPLTPRRSWSGQGGPGGPQGCVRSGSTRRDTRSPR